MEPMHLENVTNETKTAATRILFRYLTTRGKKALQSESAFAE